MADPSPQPAGGLAWSYRVPLLDNRYVWIRWAWAALAFGLGFALVLGTPLVVVFAGANGGIAFAVKVYAAIGLIAALCVVGLGVFAAVAAANGVTSRFTLGPDAAAVAASESASSGIDHAVELVGGGSQQLRNMTAAAALLLPSSGEAKWKDVRRAQFDESRRVITLRRRWRHPLRLYVPAERFSDAAAFVRDHVPARSLRAG